MISLYYGYNGLYEYWQDDHRDWLLLHNYGEPWWLVHYRSDFAYGCRYPEEAAAVIGAEFSTDYSWHSIAGPPQLVRTERA